MTRILGALLFAVMATSVPAQWLHYPTPGVPRTADGKPNLDAPAPRTADGKPDLSGLWENVRVPGRRGAAPGTPPEAPAGPPPPGPPVATFFNIGAGFKEGLLPLQPWAADLLKKRSADNDKDNPDAHCLPMGFMQFHEHPQPRKIVQTPGLILIIYEANSGLRQIFTDGRPLPHNNPTPCGYG